MQRPVGLAGKQFALHFWGEIGCFWVVFSGVALVLQMCGKSAWKARQYWILPAFRTASGFRARCI